MKKKVQFWLCQETKACAEAEARKYGISLTAWMTWLINQELLRIAVSSGKESKGCAEVVPFETGSPLKEGKGA